MPDATTEQLPVTPAPLNDNSTRISKFRNAATILACLFAILAFAFWLRLPMIVHADRHLDSDLAVDGLVLREYLRTGDLEWAYPGTPHIMTLPVFLSLPAVRVWGDSAASLVFAGTAAAMLMIVPVFLLALKAYGFVPALLAGLVLAAGGLGQVWLSARVTGGHMLSAAWLGWIWWFWTHLISRRSVLIWYVAGLICAIAFFSDRIFGLGLAALGLATLAAIRPYKATVSVSIRKNQAAIFLFSLAAHSFALNDLALSIGTAYGDQFAITDAPEAIVAHLRLLFLECLPRLIFGRVLPDGATGVTFTHPGVISNDTITGKSPIVWVLLGIAITAVMARSVSKRKLKTVDILSQSDDRRWLGPLRFGLWATTLLTFLAFVLNRNIYNSDNYRYLVLLLPGLGIAVARIAAAGPRQSLRRGLVIAFAIILTLDTLVWQSNVGFRSGFLPASRDPSKASAESADLVDILKSNPSVITADFEADYWEVYRALYLADLPIDRGQPFGFFPNRFFPIADHPSRKQSPRFVVITKSPTSMQILAQIRNEGARRVFASPNLEIYDRQSGSPIPNSPASKPAQTP
ncbi:hypothetical protein GC170_10270 [bacterium]|nr:hypothetical protein [bacterium]